MRKHVKRKNFRLQKRDRFLITMLVGVYKKGGSMIEMIYAYSMRGGQRAWFPDVTPPPFLSHSPNSLYSPESIINADR